MTSTKPTTQVGYIPNPRKIKVGYGWRLLAPDEPVIQHDESRLDGESYWCPIGPDPISTQHYGRVYRRRIQPEPGYVALAENEISGKGGRYIWHHYRGHSGTWNSVTHMRYGDAPSEWGDYDTDGLLITRPIVAPSDTLEDQIVKARQELERLEQARQKRDEIKVGDWVVFTHSSAPNKVGRVLGRASDGGIGNDGKTRTCWLTDIEEKHTRNQIHVDYLRKATPEEVAAHLAAQEIRVRGKDGLEYTADFSEPKFVRFGCAKIANQLIRGAHELTCGAPIYSGNRSVESVTIGAGTFDRDTLAKLVKYLKD